MDPHSTPTSAYETEVEAERPRGAIPALLNAVLVTGGLWALQFLSGSAPFSTWADDNGTNSAGWVATLLGDRLTYFGNGSFGDLFSGDALVHSAILTATVLVLNWLLTWLGTIGIWPRAFWPVFLGCWFAAIVATAAGQVAESLYAYFTGGRSGWLIASLDDVLESGAAYGLTYGWAIGFLIALVWLAVPGKSDEVEEYTPMSSLISGAGRPGGPGGPAGGPGGPGGGPGGYGQPLRSTIAVPTAQSSLAPTGTSGRPAQPVQVRTFTGPARGSGPAGDTAAWKDFVRDVRGRS
ncbi:hypothetical protein J2S40_000951 [Nocardioides luteus]|uniref:Uncharacterized protein n=1 Tax=Nocardioides luteus TaxID=1844 RepID=A0ABQ5SSR9_9ACTN|nr:hypothetical protein [Nocardioides luteus]MDR7309893.1 hypothetical protein [Nocardioides luteus]GGR59752.1 hypothetical protein GCM10010197_28320 [Nocardioides luteus]GLJ67198.1 hypothetical protein GCM10017579_12340 [Nocardioides luteus]